MARRERRPRRPWHQEQDVAEREDRDREQRLGVARLEGPVIFLAYHDRPLMSRYEQRRLQWHRFHRWRPAPIRRRYAGSRNTSAGTSAAHRSHRCRGPPAGGQLRLPGLRRAVARRAKGMRFRRESAERVLVSIRGEDQQEQAVGKMYRAAITPLPPSVANISATRSGRPTWEFRRTWTFPNLQFTLPMISVSCDHQRRSPGVRNTFLAAPLNGRVRCATAGPTS